MPHHEFLNLPPQEEGRQLPVEHGNLPPELFSYAQWVCWRYVVSGPKRKPDKQPVNPRTLGNAGVQWENTWSSFEQAYAMYLEHSLAGIGFVLTPDDPFVGVDLDTCVVDGEISTSAQAVVHQLRTYTEVSPSGTGLRVLVQCGEYHENRRTPQIEIYAHSRFLTLTGHHV